MRSENQLANVFTKGLDSRSFDENIDKLGLIDIFNSNLKRSVKK